MVDHNLHGDMLAFPRKRALKCIDCDVQNDWTSVEVLLPYLDPSALARAYRDWMIETWLPLDRERLMRGYMSKETKALWHVAGKGALIVGAIYGAVRFFGLYRLYERQLDYPGQSEVIEFAFQYTLLNTFPICACVSFMLLFLFIGGWPMIERVGKAR